MRIGLAYDLKEAVCVGQGHPDDALEEYDSPQTVEALASAFEAAGHSVTRLGGGREFLARVVDEQIDLVFNIAEGLGNYRSREAQVPSVLEMLGIPYSGSDPQCLAICLDKPLTKKLVAMAGVRTPMWRVIGSDVQLKAVTWDEFPFPVFVKPAQEGSSKGVRFACRAEGPEEAARAVARLLGDYRQPVLVEEFIPGDEVTVGVIGNSPPRVLGVMRVLPRKIEGDFVYTLEVKRDWERLVDYECPARLAPDVIRAIADSSLKAFEALGCRDLARIDFRVSPAGLPHFLEINPLPGLNPHSGDLPIMAGKTGLSYEALILSVVDAALGRYRLCVRA